MKIILPAFTVFKQIFKMKLGIQRMSARKRSLPVTRHCQWESELQYSVYSWHHPCSVQTYHWLQTEELLTGQTRSVQLAGIFPVLVAPSVEGCQFPTWKVRSLLFTVIRNWLKLEGIWLVRILMSGTGF